MNAKFLALLVASASAVDIRRTTPAVSLAESAATARASMMSNLELKSSSINEIARGKHCRNYTWIDRYTIHDLQSCAALVSTVPAGCENGQGNFGYREDKGHGDCHCCNIAEAQTVTDNNDKWTLY